ncbi:MAG: hypothetical protein LBP73_00865 [Clostridiales Family XIII bacterium]|jgi:hypothetical protein|nr:hypothetical protein [Clostridiales Family XIII bacterium]
MRKMWILVVLMIFVSIAACSLNSSIRPEDARQENTNEHVNGIDSELPLDIDPLKNERIEKSILRAYPEEIRIGMQKEAVTEYISEPVEWPDSGDIVYVPRGETQVGAWRVLREQFAFSGGGTLTGIRMEVQCTDKADDILELFGNVETENNHIRRANRKYWKPHDWVDIDSTGYGDGPIFAELEWETNDGSVLGYKQYDTQAIVYQYASAESTPEYPPMKGIVRDIELGFAGLRLGMKPEDVANIVGQEPVTSAQRVIDDDIAEISQSFSNGLKASYHSFQGAEYALSSLTLDNAAYETYRGLRVGDARIRLIDLYGLPSNAEDDIWDYAEDTGMYGWGYDFYRFLLEDGYVKEINIHVAD